jgi:hypothetical protein
MIVWSHKIHNALNRETSRERFEDMNALAADAANVAMLESDAARGNDAAQAFVEIVTYLRVLRRAAMREAELAPPDPRVCWIANYEMERR